MAYRGVSRCLADHGAIMIVIHIGLPKCGSSSVQNFLRDNDPVLRSMRIHYPHVGRMLRPNHINLSFEAKGHPQFDPAFGTLTQLAGYRRSVGADVMILSSENLASCKSEHAARMKSALGGLDDTFRIVMIIRDLVQFLPSAYSQEVRNGKRTFDFDTFFEAQQGRRRIDYSETAKRWADVFGWMALRVRVLDPRHLVNGDLIDDFLATAGVDLKAVDLGEFKRPHYTNPSPGWRVQEAVRAVLGGRHGLPPDHLLSGAAEFGRAQREVLGLRAREAGEARGWNADRGRYLSQEQAQRCLGSYRQIIETLNRELPEPLPAPPSLEERGFIPREFMPSAEHIPGDELRAFYDEVAVRLETPVSRKRRRTLDSKAPYKTRRSPSASAENP